MGISGGPYIVRDSSLVLELDAADKNSYVGSGTVWYDLSGNNNTGTLTNGPTFNGANGGSIVFDGTNDYVDCGNNTSLNFTNEITVTAWIKVSSQTSYKGIVDKGRDNFGAWSLAINETTTPAATFKVRISGVNRTIIANSNYGDNIWTHIAARFNGTQLAIYQNGFLSNNASYSGTIGTNAINVRIGAANDGLYFPGSIANVSIYSQAILPREISQIYQEQKSRFGL